jgi:hypothetical protein
MSRAITKPTKCVCEQNESRPACSSTQSNQDPGCLLTNSITSRDTDSEQNGSWSDCAGSSGSMLVANPLYWFCLDTSYLSYKRIISKLQIFRWATRCRLQIKRGHSQFHLISVCWCIYGPATSNILAVSIRITWGCYHLLGRRWCISAPARTFDLEKYQNV